MHIATDPHRLPLAPRALARGCAVTIGNFDGVHCGHRELISQVIEKARATSLPAVVITFEPHPLRVILGDAAPPSLMSLHHKLEILADLGVDLVLVMPFSRETASMAPEDFVSDVLVSCLNTRHLVVGYDYAFGKGRRGNAALLTELGREHGFSVEQLSPVFMEGDIISSTRIREALKAGHVDEAARLLCRPHSVEGTVVHGMNRGGKLLGFPTANLRADDDLLLPKSGVYAVLAEIGSCEVLERHTLPPVFLGNAGPFLRGVANVGNNPTFGDEFLRVEAHLLDFHRDIYGARIRVHFIHRLRDERKFNGVGELVEQIHRDVARAKDILPRDGS